MNSKVLVVDDEEFLREVLVEGLIEDGYDVFSAPNAMSALQIMRENDIELVITDMMLPEESGFEFMAQAQQIPHSHSRFIMITGHPNIHLEDVQSKGAKALLSKPFSDVLFRETVKNVLHPHH